MPDKDFHVECMRNSVYMNKGGRVIQGYEVTVYLPEYDEEFSLKVPDNSPATIDKAIKKLIERRKQIADLG